MEFEGRKKRLQLPKQLDVIVESKIRMVTTLKKELLTAVFKGFRNFFLVFFYGRNVAFGMTWPPVKVAEFAIGYADIRGIRVAVNNPGNHILWYVMLAQGVPHIHQLGGFGTLKKKKSFFGSQKLPFKRSVKEVVYMHGDYF